jgi:hypothetical protein
MKPSSCNRDEFESPVGSLAVDLIPGDAFARTMLQAESVNHLQEQSSNVPQTASRQPIISEVGEKSPSLV